MNRQKIINLIFTTLPNSAKSITRDGLSLVSLGHDSCAILEKLTDDKLRQVASKLTTMT